MWFGCIACIQRHVYAEIRCECLFSRSRSQFATCKKHSQAARPQKELLAFNVSTTQNILDASDASVQTQTSDCREPTKTKKTHPIFLRRSRSNYLRSHGNWTTQHKRREREKAPQRRGQKKCCVNRRSSFWMGSLHLIRFSFEDSGKSV